jgi:restriction endonuclease
MRVSISGEKSFVNALQEEIKKDSEIKVEKLEEAKDKTELAFAIGDIVTLVSLVKGVTDLVKALLEMRDKKPSEKRQKLYLKTALGTATIEISKDITAEELSQQLGKIFPS